MTAPSFSCCFHRLKLYQSLSFFLASLDDVSAAYKISIRIIFNSGLSGNCYVLSNCNAIRNFGAFCNGYKITAVNLLIILAVCILTDTNRTIFSNNCILCDDVEVGTAADATVAVYLAGCFNPDKLTMASSYTMKEADKDALRDAGIVFKAASPM